MKTITTVKKEITELKETNRLYKRVINEIITDSKNYNGNFIEQVKSRIEDVQHGCSTGIVSSLVYYSDTTKFFKLYQDEITELLTELLHETGCSISELLRDFDTNDPFCKYEQNQNLLSWFAYEEINNKLSYIFEM